jgi:hypothetical protein
LHKLLAALLEKTVQPDEGQAAELEGCSRTTPENLYIKERSVLSK